MWSVTNLSSEKNLPTFPLNASVIIMSSSLFTLMTTEPFSQNIGKLFSELKLVTDDLPLYLHKQHILYKLYPSFIIDCGFISSCIVFCHRRINSVLFLGNFLYGTYACSYGTGGMWKFYIFVSVLSVHTNTSFRFWCTSY